VQLLCYSRNHSHRRFLPGEKVHSRASEETFSRGIAPGIPTIPHSDEVFDRPCRTGPFCAVGRMCSRSCLHVLSSGVIANDASRYARIGLMCVRVRIHFAIHDGFEAKDNHFATYRIVVTSEWNSATWTRSLHNCVRIHLICVVRGSALRCIASVHYAE
jgi:hypothetical protein